MPLHPLGFSHRRDIPNSPKLAAGSVDLRWSIAGDLACAFIDAPHDDVQPKLHAATLDAIHRRFCILPARFGVALSDEAEIHALLQSRSEELLNHLDRLNSTCEMALRITVPSPPKTEAVSASKPDSPFGYIEGRRSYYREIDESAERDGLIVRQVVERLKGSYREWRKLQPSPSYPIRLALLVERDRVSAFRSRVEDARGACPEGRCVVLGPWPPYSFV